MMLLLLFLSTQKAQDFVGLGSSARAINTKSIFSLVVYFESPAAPRQDNCWQQGIGRSLKKLWCCWCSSSWWTIFVIFDLKWAKKASIFIFNWKDSIKIFSLIGMTYVLDFMDARYFQLQNIFFRIIRIILWKIWVIWCLKSFETLKSCIKWKTLVSMHLSTIVMKCSLK